MTTLKEYPGRRLGGKPEHPRTGRFLADAQGGTDRATTVPFAPRYGLVRDAQAERQSLAASRPAVRLCRRQSKSHSAKSPALPSPLDSAPARAHSPASNPEGSGVVHLRHPFTKEYDQEGGLQYMLSRWYNSESGSFISRAVVLALMEHPYNFVLQNPVSMVDPGGAWPSSDEIQLALLLTPNNAAIAAACMADAWAAGTSAYYAYLDSGPAFKPRADAASNAIRHCTWMCCLARHLGCQPWGLFGMYGQVCGEELAIMIGDAHEVGPGQVGTPDSDVDYANNEIGRNLAKCKGDCADLCRRSWALNQLYYQDGGEPIAGKPPL